MSFVNAFTIINDKVLCERDACTDGHRLQMCHAFTPGAVPRVVSTCHICKTGRCSGEFDDTIRALVK